MASDGIPVSIPVTRLVQGSRARTSELVQATSGKTFPPTGEAVPASAVPQVPAVHQAAKTVHDAYVTPAIKPKVSEAKKPDIPALVTQLNKHFSHSGRPDQFRLDASSGRKMIQQINADTGDVIGEYSEALFPTLAQGLGNTGRLVDIKA